MTPEQRRQNMQHIRSVDSKPEVIVRKMLWNAGYRYRKNDKRIEGKPDIYLPKYKTVIFVNGCFWHRHQNCRKKLSTPKTNPEYWTKKFARNMQRDIEIRNTLSSKYKIIIIWECAINTYKKTPQIFLEKIQQIIACSDYGYYEID